MTNHGINRQGDPLNGGVTLFRRSRPPLYRLLECRPKLTKRPDSTVETVSNLGGVCRTLEGTTSPLFADKMIVVGRTVHHRDADLPRGDHRIGCWAFIRRCGSRCLVRSVTAVETGSVRRAVASSMMIPDCPDTSVSRAPITATPHLPLQPRAEHCLFGSGLSGLGNVVEIDVEFCSDFRHLGNG